jgi:hypothetical protein
LNSKPLSLLNFCLPFFQVVHCTITAETSSTMDPQNEPEVPPHPTFSSMISTEESDQRSFSDDRFGLYVFTVAGCVALAVILLLSVREFYLSKYNFDIFPFAYRRRSTPSHLDSDREMAEELQRQLNEEEREADRMKKRAERKEWYQSYLNPFTMVCKKMLVFYQKYCRFSIFCHIQYMLVYK